MDDARWIDESAVVSPDAVLEAPCQVAGGVTVAAGARVEAGSSVAADAQIEARAQLRGAVVQERANVGEGAIVEDAIVGPRAQIGAGAHIESAAVIGPGVSIPRRGDRRRGRARVPRGCPRRSGRRPMSRYEEMFGLVGQLGAQLREGYAAGHAALGAARAERPATAMVSALGGSAIGGSLAEALWRDSARVPIFVNRAATLPGWVGEGELVLPVSYSGSTAETLAAARSALGRGADVIAVTAGGPLQRLVADGGGQVVTVPGGLPPRAALGTLFGAVAAALEHVGAVPPVPEDIRAAAHACDAVAARSRRQPRARARRSAGRRPRPGSTATARWPPSRGASRAS